MSGKKLFKRVFFVGSVALSSAIVYTQYQEYSYERAIGDALQERVNAEQLRRDRLHHELDHHLSYEYVERAVRDHLGLVKEHEMIFIDFN